MITFNPEAFIAYAHKHFPALCEPRAADSHKGTFGSLGVIGGAQGMVGAPLLAARAALKQGTGRVYIGFAQTTVPIAIDPLHAEIMLKTAQELLDLRHLSSITIGCGLGLTDLSQKLFAHSLEQFAQLPIVIDADGLNLLAQATVDIHNQTDNVERIRETYQQSTGKAIRVLTPHPTEAARLLSWSTEQVQNNRPSALNELVQRYSAWVVLKGHETLIAAPDGSVIINPSGNPGLASGGTGDVLAGMIAALLAQGIPPKQAIAGAVWLHGAAADYLVSQGIGPVGLCASEVLIAARTLRNLLVVY